VDLTAFGLNGKGQVVGDSDDPRGWAGTEAMPDWRFGFLCSHGRMENLNSLLDKSGSGWTVNHAYSINDAGQIVGSARNDKTGLIHAVLLTPVGGRRVRG
jgi:uncharacterized membrane protein